MNHALRLNGPVSLSLWRLHLAGPRGLAQDVLDHAGLLEASGMAEFFTDETRVLRARIRITALGGRVASALIAPQRSTTCPTPH